MPFEQVVEILNVIGGANISASSVWRLTNKWGKRMQEVKERERENALGLSCGHQMAGEKKETSRRMGIAMDGVMMHVREEGWKEVKIGCVYHVVPCQVMDPETKEMTTIGGAHDISHVAHLGGPERFGEMLWAEAWQRGWTRAGETQVIGDAAVWIWNLTGEHLYTSHQTVDWCHVVEHLAGLARLLYDEGTPAARRWLNQLKKALFQGDIEGIEATLRRAAKRHPKHQAALLREADFFQRNKRRMNYLEMRNERWLIGSGPIESDAKQIKGRVAGPGMRWSRPGADNILLIKTEIMSHRFDRYWKAAYALPPN